MSLFAGISSFLLDELVNQFWDKFDILDFSRGKQQAREAKKSRSVCNLTINDKMIFTVQGDILIFSEVVEPHDNLVQHEQKSTFSLIKLLRSYQHFGDSFYPNLDSIKGAFRLRLQTRDVTAQWITINRRDFEDAVEVINKTVFLENAYEQKADDYQDLVFRIQQVKEASVYDKLRYFILLYSQKKQFDLKTFNQQVIADAIQCDRTAVNKEFKALQRLDCDALGITLKDKLLTFKILPEMAPSLPAFQRFKLFLDTLAKIISTAEKTQQLGDHSAQQLRKLTWNHQTKTKLLEQTGISERQLGQILQNLVQESSNQYAIQLQGTAETPVLFYSSMPAKSIQVERQ